ncbi:hypothetical protein BgAZ_403300 [Babesia gibsoni]|uniref:Uncharacterized protein n=1 Tax=Babesia gibsoni TaxID=33632 RepID=A0AAD8LRK7_BABGI|nr:hypothetical protein BgAZ_403300 [Babesia gibsoni]
METTETQMEDGGASQYAHPEDAQTLSQGAPPDHYSNTFIQQAADDDSNASSSEEEEEEEDEGLTQPAAAESEVEMTYDDDVTASQAEAGLETMEVGNYSKERSDKDILVAKLLCRWWYVLPDWPPANYNYHDKLEANRLKCYSVKEFEDHENVDSNGYRKCYQISAFPGVFRDFKGIAYDLRPEEGKPCYNNMIKKSESELIDLIKAAINKQISLLNSSKYDESELIKQLKRELSAL